MKQDKPNTIRRMLVFRLLMLPMVVLLLICATIVFYLITYSGNQVKNDLMRTAWDHRNLIDHFLTEKNATLRFICTSNNLESISNPVFLNRLFKSLEAESKAFMDLGVIDEQGNHLAYAGPYDLAGKTMQKLPGSRR